jgi:hypothetical protein
MVQRLRIFAPIRRLAICIGSLEHMREKRAVVVNVYRVLRPSGRFFCPIPDGDYIWYRWMAPILGFATKHLSTDRFLGRQEFSEVLEQVGFRKVEINPWTFIPTGDFPVLIRFVVGRARQNRPLHTNSASTRRARRVRLEGVSPS